MHLRVLKYTQVYTNVHKSAQCSKLKCILMYISVYYCLRCFTQMYTSVHVHVHYCAQY
jgi:hypothetical protein